MGSCLSADSRSPYPGSPSSPSQIIKRRKSSKKVQGSRSSSNDSRRKERLHRIPGRMFLNGSSEVASLFTQQGKKGPNQDAMIAWENFASRSDTIFCGVFDGHGPYGHMVAKKVRDALPLKLIAHLDENISGENVFKEININATGSLKSEQIPVVSTNEESRASVCYEETDWQPEIYKKMRDLFLRAFRVMDRELKVHRTLDCLCSGTTAVTLVKQGRNIIIGNVGDSRAVLGTKDKNGALVAVQLTVDLKPNLPAEAERIRRCKGRVFALRDEPEVVRVWLPNNDTPGLAMARAFGDFCLKDFGVIAVPEISYRQVHEKDEFIVLATDGIWDVFSNAEVVNIIASAPSHSSAARFLVNSAVRAWRYKYPTSKVDDCAVVCLFLNTKQSTLSNASSRKLENQTLSTASSRKLENQSTSEEQGVAGSEDDNIPVPTSLDRTGTVRTGNITLEGTQEENLEGELQSGSGTDWSALEGVSRVNTLLNMPRFAPQK